jgi:hypothetical protein
MGSPDLETSPLKEKFELAKEILSTPFIRPEPSRVVGLSDIDIDTAAKELNYPIYSCENYLKTHNLSLPLMQLAVDRLVSLHEKEKPYYYVIARDGEMFYDAMVSRFSAEMNGRIHSVAASGHNKGHVVHNDTRNETDYLASIGLAKSSLESGKKLVFVDSGYNGTEFKTILEHHLQVPLDSELMQNVSGYLIYRRPDSMLPFEQLGWDKDPGHAEFADVMYGNIMSEDILDTEFGKTSNNADYVSRALCNWMQIQPKFTFKYTNYQDLLLRWLPLPPESLRHYPVEGAKTVLQGVDFGNDDIVDPVIALKLISRTADYFINKAE